MVRGADASSWVLLGDARALAASIEKMQPDLEDLTALFRNDDGSDYDKCKVGFQKAVEVATRLETISQALDRLDDEQKAKAKQLECTKERLKEQQNEERKVSDRLSDLLDRQRRTNNEIEIASTKMDEIFRRTEQVQKREDAVMEAERRVEQQAKEVDNKSAELTNQRQWLKKESANVSEKLVRAAKLDEENSTLSSELDQQLEKISLKRNKLSLDLKALGRQTETQRERDAELAIREAALENNRSLINNREDAVKDRESTVQATSLRLDELQASLQEKKDRQEANELTQLEKERVLRKERRELSKLKEELCKAFELVFGQADVTIDLSSAADLDVKIANIKRAARLISQGLRDTLQNHQRPTTENEAPKSETLALRSELDRFRTGNSNDSRQQLSSLPKAKTDTEASLRAQILELTTANDQRAQLFRDKSQDYEKLLAYENEISHLNAQIRDMRTENYKTLTEHYDQSYVTLKNIKKDRDAWKAKYEEMHTRAGAVVEQECELRRDRDELADQKRLFEEYRRKKKEVIQAAKDIIRRGRSN